MTTILVLLYAVAALTRSKSVVMIAGTLLSAMLYPLAFITSIAIVLIAANSYRLKLSIASISAFILAIIFAKNTWPAELSTSAAGISFVLFQSLFLFNQQLRVTLMSAVQLTFYPQLICGPILQPKAYNQIPISSSRISAYSNALFIGGMFAKCWASDVLGPYSALNQYGFLFSPLVLTKVYTDYLGWCLMASAIGLQCGVRVPRNFRYPLRVTTVAEFWHRWNTTLNHWVRYAFKTPESHPQKTGPRVRRVFVYTSILGLWHGLTINFLLFSLFNAVLVLVQQSSRSRITHAISQAIFLAAVGILFTGTLPKVTISIDPEIVIRATAAIVAVSAIEFGAVYVLYRAFRNSSTAKHLAPLIILILIVVRPYPQPFVYAEF